MFVCFFLKPLHRCSDEAYEATAARPPPGASGGKVLALGVKRPSSSWMYALCPAEKLLEQAVIGKGSGEEREVSRGERKKGRDAKKKKSSHFTSCEWVVEIMQRWPTLKLQDRDAGAAQKQSLAVAIDVSTATMHRVVLHRLRHSARPKYSEQKQCGYPEELVNGVRKADVALWCGDARWRRVRL